MAYTPTEWETGDVITAEKLNKMELGIEDAADAADTLADVLDPFIITCTATAQDFSGTIDKTPAQIKAAIEAGKRILVSFPATGAVVNGAGYNTAPGGNVAVFWYVLYYNETSSTWYWVRGMTSYTSSTYTVDMFTLTHVVSGS